MGLTYSEKGLTLPEVSLVAILDADKEGFPPFRTGTYPDNWTGSRNSNGHVIMYADRMTDSMTKAMDETERRRDIQRAYNEKHGITPTTIKKDIHNAIRATRCGGRNRKLY